MGTGIVPVAVDAISAARLAGVVPALRVRVEQLLEAFAVLGLPLRVTQGRRTVEEQLALYAQGRTAPGPVVTWTLKSTHLTGRAVDVVWKTADGGVTYEGPWALWGLAAEEVGLVWGGRWARPDRPHVELPNAVGDDDV